MQFPGRPSDEVDDVLATGRGEITTMFVSMATRHPNGADAEYLRWHTLDHRPEQYRLASVRASLRLVSTPACRSARSVDDGPLDAVDHVMTYFFSDKAGLRGFYQLGAALSDAGRMAALLPPVQRGVYDVGDKVASPRVKAGSDVLPWLPVRGVFLLVERGSASVAPLTDVEGVAGVWSARSHKVDAAATGKPGDQSITYCFADDNPIAVAERLRPVLADRWADSSAEPLFAAPFFVVVPFEWDRYLP